MSSRSKIRVESATGEFEFEAGPGEPLLFAGLSKGLTLPYECGTGTCGTCRARVTAGSVEIAWDDAPGFARLKRDKGDILMCQARAATDCTLRVAAKVAGKPERHPVPAAGSGRIARMHMLTHDVVEIDVALDRPMPWIPGQFAVLEIDGIAGGRAYSMVADGDARRLLFVVKKKPGGVFSEWLFSACRDETPVRIFGALGRATFHPEEKRNILCIAGGSGIAGMVAIVEKAQEAGAFSTHAGHVFFGVRTLADGFYLDRFAKVVAASGGRLDVTLALSHASAETPEHPQFPGIRLASGFVHEVAAKAMSGRYDNVVAFTAGPTPMVDGVLKTLRTEAKLPSEFIRYDKFS